MTEYGDGLLVKISNRDKRLWEGNADSVTSENSKGRFDILKEHANFVTMITGKPIEVKNGEEKKVFTYRNAVIAVSKNIVNIYTDI